SGHRSRVIEGPGKDGDPGLADPAVGRFYSCNPVGRSRSADRPAGIAAGRCKAQASGYCCTRPAARPRRNMVQIPGIFCWTRVKAKRELVRGYLAQYNCAGFAKLADDG